MGRDASTGGQQCCDGSIGVKLDDVSLTTSSVTYRSS